MTFAIIVLLIVLLLLSWKYIVRFEPAGIFAAMWVFFSGGVLLLQDIIVLRFDGILFILICITAFVLGTIFCDTVYTVKPSNVQLTFNKQLATPLLIILLIGATVNPIYSIILHGFSLQVLLDMRELLEMNKDISADRYSGGEVYSVFNQFFLIFSYAAPVFGGFCYRMVNKFVKVICILTLVPGTFIALTQSMKMGMMTSFILWFASYIVCSYTYGLPILIKPRILLRFTIIIAGFLFVLFISMVFRTGEVSERTIHQISERFVTYAFGHMHCFDMWYTTHAPTDISFGSKTFMGITNLLGIENRIQGIYTEFYQIGKNGFYGMANVYTVFRPLIEDFGEVGTTLVMFLMGYGAKVSLKNLIVHNSIYVNQVVLIAVFAYEMWSFVASFYAYTSYLAMFFVAYVLFHFLQKIEVVNATD